MDSEKTSIVFVSGAWHTEFHFQPCIAPFERRGYRIITCPILANGIKDPRPVFAEEVQNVVSKMTAEVLSGQNICLMAHSAGGVIACEAASQFLLGAAFEQKARLTDLIFLASFLNLGRTFKRSDEVGWRKPNPENGYLYVEDPARVFYNTMTAADAQPFVDALVPFKRAEDTPVTLENEAWKKVPKRTYVACSQDQVQIPEFQDLEIEESGWSVAGKEKKFDHCPFVSKPEEFVGVVDGILRS